MQTADVINIKFISVESWRKTLLNRNKKSKYWLIYKKTRKWLMIIIWSIGKAIQHTFYQICKVLVSELQKETNVLDWSIPTSRTRHWIIFCFNQVYIFISEDIQMFWMYFSLISFTCISSIFIDIFFILCIFSL